MARRDRGHRPLPNLGPGRGEPRRRVAGVEDERAAERLETIAADEEEPKVVRSTAARSLEADAGKFRRQFTGGLENDSTDLPGESRLNRRPDL